VDGRAKIALWPASRALPVAPLDVGSRDAEPRRVMPLVRRAVACALLAACTPLSPAAPSSPAASASASTPAAIAEVARWLPGGGATLIGPRLPQGTLVLLGGRRALLRDDGALETERAVAPEPLEGLVLVPTTSGDRLVGYSRHGVYRFDEPLGAAVLLGFGRGDQDAIARAAPGPGLVALWHHFWASGPTLIDVTTGALRTLPGLPPVEIEALAFRTPREGAVLLAGLGLAVTTDAGTTFHTPTAPRQSLSADGLERRGDEVRAFGWGGSTAIDLGGGAPGVLRPDPAPSAPLLRWIAVTGLDPLRAAVDAGIRGAPRDTAFVAARGLLARIRLESGAVDDLVELPIEASPTERMNALFGMMQQAEPCPLARRGGRGFILCPHQRPFSFALAGPLRLDPPDDLGPESLIIYPTAVARSPTGALLFEGTCGPGGSGALCVLARSGIIEPVAPAIRFASERPAPLADGRIAWLADGEPLEPTEDDPRPRVRRHFAVGERDGTVRELPSFEMPGYPGRRVESIEEGVDGTLRALVQTGSEVHLLRQAGRGQPAEVTTVPGFSAALRDGRAVAVGIKLSISEDGGASWAEVPGPRLGLVGHEDLAVGENGLRIRERLRIGWGGAAPFAPPPEPESSDPAGARRLSHVERHLACTSAGDGGAATPFEKEEDLTASFARATGPAPATGKRVIADRLSTSGDVSVRLEAEAPDPIAPAPTRWTLRWIDPLDPASPAGVFRVPAPAGSGWQLAVRAAARAGRRFVFAVASGDTESFLVDLPARGPARIARIEGRDVADFALGPRDADPIAFHGPRGVHVWPLGGDPRPLFDHVGVRDGHFRFAPPRDGALPVLLHGDAWAALHTHPLGQPAGWIPLSGWQPLELGDRRFEALPTCRGESRAPTFVTALPGLLGFELDGHELRGFVSRPLVQVRVDGSAACFARLDLSVSRPAKIQRRDDALVHVGIDLVQGSGLGHETGPKSRIRKLRCTLR
jgi:hypothetical protein